MASARCSSRPFPLPNEGRNRRSPDALTPPTTARKGSAASWDPVRSRTQPGHDAVARPRSRPTSPPLRSPDPSTPRPVPTRSRPHEPQRTWSCRLAGSATRPRQRWHVRSLERHGHHLLLIRSELDRKPVQNIGPHEGQRVVRLGRGGKIGAQVEPVRSRLEKEGPGFTSERTIVSVIRVENCFPRGRGRLRLEALAYTVNGGLNAVGQGTGPGARDPPELRPCLPVSPRSSGDTEGGQRNPALLEHHPAQRRLVSGFVRLPNLDLKPDFHENHLPRALSQSSETEPSGPARRPRTTSPTHSSYSRLPPSPPVPESDTALRTAWGGPRSPERPREE